VEVDKEGVGGGGVVRATDSLMSFPIAVFVVGATAGHDDEVGQ
jgi:hypothetical protein